MANPDRIPIHFSLANVSKRLQNIDTSKIPTREDLADVIVMLNMRPGEVRSLQINHYELDSSNIPAWYKEGYSWYCTDYLKSRGERRKILSPGHFFPWRRIQNASGNYSPGFEMQLRLKSYVTRLY